MAYSEQQRCRLESKIATSAGIGRREIISATNGSSNDNHRDVDEERHDESKAALYKEVSAGRLSKTYNSDVSELFATQQRTASSP